MNKWLFSLAFVLLTACNIGMDGDEEALRMAEKFGDAFFNCDFHEAAQYCTPDSKQWLQFAASNTTQQDLALLQQHEEGATVELEDVFSEANDTLRMVLLHVENHLSIPAIGDTATLVDESDFKIKVVKRDGEWLVKMEGLPRNERQSRD